jgi:hypothetical protein
MRPDLSSWGVGGIGKTSLLKKITRKLGQTCLVCGSLLWISITIEGDFNKIEGRVMATPEYSGELERIASVRNDHRLSVHHGSDCGLRRRQWVYF